MSLRIAGWRPSPRIPLSACGGGSSSPSSSGAIRRSRPPRASPRRCVRRHRQVRSDHEQENYTRPRSSLRCGLRRLGRGRRFRPLPRTTRPQNDTFKDKTSDGISNFEYGAVHSCTG